MQRTKFIAVNLVCLKIYSQVEEKQMVNFLFGALTVIAVEYILFILFYFGGIDK
jgi:hypothetical protein